MFYIKIYLDDSIDNNILIAILEDNGFTVISPRDYKMAGKRDDEHLRFAVMKDAVVLTYDRNFPTPTPRIPHCGILIVYKYNELKKNLTPQKILRALRNIQRQDLNLDNKTLPMNIFNY